MRSTRSRLFALFIWSALHKMAFVVASESCSGGWDIWHFENDGELFESRYSANSIQEMQKLVEKTINDEHSSIRDDSLSYAQHAYVPQSYVGDERDVVFDISGCESANYLRLFRSSNGPEISWGLVAFRRGWAPW